jgi:hypothetical protein
MVGLVWALWHLPLFMMVGTSQHELGIPFIGFLVGFMANSVLYTWLYNNTKQSLWSAILLHWLYTYAAQVLSSGVTRSPLYNWLEYLPYVTIAAIVVLIWKPQTLSRPQKTLDYTNNKSDSSDANCITENVTMSSIVASGKMLLSDRRRSLSEEQHDEPEKQGRVGRSSATTVLESK